MFVGVYDAGCQWLMCKITAPTFDDAYNKFVKWIDDYDVYINYNDILIIDMSSNLAEI